MSDMVIEALKAHFEPEEIVEANAGRCDGHYGLAVYEVDDMEIAVGTDEECGLAVTQAVKESLWAFNAEFIASFCGIDGKRAVDGLRKMQESLCEDANDLILAMVQGGGGLEEFVEQAVSADGRGHFISQYDGNEIDLGDGLYAYRVN